MVDFVASSFEDKGFREVLTLLCCFQQPLEEQNVSNSHQCDIIPLYVPGHVMYIEEASDTG